LFAFRLARQCGYPHPRMMLAQMTSSEFGEALAYDRIDPCGEYRNERRHGQHMAMLANFNLNLDEPAKPVEFMNFMNQPEEPDLTPEQIEARLDRIFGG